MDQEQAQTAPNVGSDVGLAGGDLAERIRNLSCDPPFEARLGRPHKVAYQLGHADARAAAAKLAAAAVPQWTDEPAGPGCYWVKNWSDVLERMNYRIVEIFEIPPGGWNRNGRYLSSGLYVHEHGREWPDRLDCAFGSGGYRWEKLGFMLIPEPTTDEPANISGENRL